MEKINKIALEKIAKDVPFAIPENYFENFAVQFEQQLQTKQPKHRKLFKSWMYAAAVFIGVVIVGQLGYNLKTQNALTNETYEMYVLSQVDEPALMDYYVDDSEINSSIN